MVRSNKFSDRLLPSPRLLLLLGGLLYFCLGYVSGSCMRMLVALTIFILPAIFWRMSLRLSQMVGRLPVLIQRMVVAGGTALYFWTVSTLPAQAMFLGKLCGLMQSVVSGAGSSGNIDGLITATVNVVRALFILYLAIALIGVFNQMQRDEEWQVAARTPLLAVVIVGIVEAISNLIVPGSVSTC